MVTLTRFAGNPILRAEPRNSWEAHSVFNAATVLKDDKVWIFYRACDRPPGQIYVSSIGLATSGDDFQRARVPGWVCQGQHLEPQADYELHGDVKNVVFSCGHVVKNDTFFLYYLRRRRHRHGRRHLPHVRHPSLGKGRVDWGCRDTRLGTG